MAVFCQCQTLKGVTYRMPQVKGLADAVLKRILLHNVFLHLHRPTYQLFQFAVVNVLSVEGKQLAPMGRGAY
ncbi:hypothetical protein SDC9_182899 [bioreactor metagenome]|uniref:Uncharacterized protein n=1 Tax=bioreactor metagenome TaxID=1076179 RepID=A0A645H8N7_9ZZZZ